MGKLLNYINLIKGLNVLTITCPQFGCQLPVLCHFPKTFLRFGGCGCAVRTTLLSLSLHIRPSPVIDVMNDMAGLNPNE